MKNEGQAHLAPIFLNPHYFYKKLPAQAEERTRDLLISFIFSFLEYPH
jgi:hypothetical protein